jgi:high affinity Mn2+ porin
MGRILLGSAALAAVTLPIWARAEDRPAQWDKAATAISAYDWSGFYLGAHVGYVGGASNWSATQPGGGSNIGGSLDLFQPLDAFTQDGSFLGGIQAGYNIMLPSRAVAGVEADVSFPGMIGAGQNFATPIVGAANYNDALEMFGTVRGRFGYDVDGWLYYATGGLAWSYDHFARTQLASG